MDRQAGKRIAFATGAALAMGAWVGWRWARRQRLHRYRFAGQSVLITGGSRGLGLVLARQLAREGARIGLLARNEVELASAADELRQMGARVAAVPCDLRQAESTQAAVSRVAEELGGLDMVINNAGVIQVGPMAHMSDADLAEALDLSAWAPWRVVRAAMPYLQRAGEGRIVNVCSIGGKIAMPHLMPYAVGKFAEVGLSDAMRAELRRDNIYVTTVFPGLMRTGSPRNAMFKGQHRREFAWFAISDSLPGVSINVEKAARQILNAARRRAPALYITPQARIAAIANEVTPGLVARLTATVNRMLPGPNAKQSIAARPGRRSRSGWAPSILTRLSDRAASRNNEVAGDGRGAGREARSSASPRPDTDS